MNIAIIGDLHLGYRQYGFDERELDFYQRWHQIINDIISRKNVDVVLQLGDIFDTHIPSSIALYEYERGLENLQQNNIRYYSITGNHTIIKRKNFMSPDDLFSKISDACLIDDTYVIEDDNVFIAGVKYRSESNKEELLDVIKQHVLAAQKYDGIKILLLHQAVDVDLAFGAELTENDLPFDDFDYIFIGHLHSRIERSHKKCRIVYPGSIERSSTTEARDAIKRGKGFYLLNTDKNQLGWVDIPLNRAFYFYEIEEEDDINKIKEEISQLNYKPIVELNFNQVDVERAYDIGQNIADDCLKLNIVVENEQETNEDIESLTEQSISSILNMLEGKLSKNQAIFAYELLKIFNKNATHNENIESAIEVSETYFQNNY